MTGCNNEGCAQQAAKIEAVRELADKAADWAVLDNQYPPKWSDDVLKILDGDS